MLSEDIERVNLFLSTCQYGENVIESWQRIKAALVESTNSTHNSARDAIAAWENHVKWHLKMNGPGCDISKNEMCKHWFVMGYNAATAPVA